MQLIFIEILAFVVLPILLLIFISGIVRRVSREGWKIKGEIEIRVNELCQNLQMIGIGTSVLGKLNMWDLSRIRGQPHGFWEEVPAIIKLEGRDIDSINFITADYYGRIRPWDWYNLDFIVGNSSPHERTRSSKTRLAMKRSFRGNLLVFINIWSAKVVDVEWRGDADLARELNLDDRLRDRLLNADLGNLHYLKIVPEPKYGCTRIRTNYFLPTIDLFNIVETIAKHIKSV